MNSRPANITRLFLVSCLLLLVASPVLAAEIFYDTEIKEVRVGTEFEIGIFLNTEKENINALEGVVRFPTDLLEFKKIRDGNSIINFWVERPYKRQATRDKEQETRDKEQGEIVFSGITPGGFLGEKGLIFTVTFLAKNEGRGQVEIREIKALLNDGQGTEAEISVSPLEIVVTSQALPLPSKKDEKDIELPELFVPEVANDPDIFEGKHFLVFATQDKKSGILHYEVKEARQRIFDFSNWVEAESPYVLQDQELRSYIFVKAVDKAGNERIVKILPQNPLKWYENYENWIMIVVGLAIAYALRKFLWRKHIRA